MIQDKTQIEEYLERLRSISQAGARPSLTQGAGDPLLPETSGAGYESADSSDPEANSEQLTARSFRVYLKHLRNSGIFLILLSVSLMQLSSNYYDIWLQGYI